MDHVRKLITKDQYLPAIGVSILISEFSTQDVASRKKIIGKTKWWCSLSKGSDIFLAQIPRNMTLGLFNLIKNPDACTLMSKLGTQDRTW